MSSPLQTAITFIKSGDTGQGRQLLVELLQAEPKNELAWLWLSNVVSTDEQRRHCLKQVLSINPQHPLAQKGLAILQQKSQTGPVGSTTTAAAQPGPSLKLSQPLPAPPLTAITNLEPAVPSPVQPDALTPPAKPRPRSLTSTQPVASPQAEKKPPAKALKPPNPQPAKPVYEDAPVKESKRIWIHPKSSVLYRVVILYDDGIALVANPDKTTVLQLAVSQEPPDRAGFGRNLTWLSIYEITAVEAVPGIDSVYVRFTRNNRPGLKRIPLANATALDEFMNACQTNWGTSFESTLKPYNMFASMVIPLFIFGAVILLTYFLHGAAVEIAAGNSPEIRGRRVLLQYLVLGLLTLLGPTGVLIVGIFLAALTLFWVFASMLNPPSRTILTRIKHPAAALPSTSTSTTPAIQPLSEKPHSGSAAKPQGVKIPAKTTPRSVQAKATVRDKAEKQELTTLLIRSFLIVLIFAAIGWAGFLYLNRPPAGYPGLIEGGTAIDLSHRGLTNADLRALALHTYPQTGLVTLDLSDNPLTELPPEIGQMTNLESLYIKNTPLQTLPPEIGQLSNLRTLNLQDSRLTSVPPEVGQLYHLDYLDLQGNKLRALPLEISRLPNLRTLNIQRTMIQRLPPEFEQKPNLEILYWYFPFE